MNIKYCLFVTVAVLQTVIVQSAAVVNQAPQSVGYRTAFEHESIGGSCILPAAWHGQWVQHSKGALNISHKHISGKGHCVDNDQYGNYLFTSTRSDGSECHRCLFMFANHLNVLQYKETSSCGRLGSLSEVCGRIYADNPLLTLFRVDGSPVSCPVAGPASYTYRDTHGQCSSVQSELFACATDTRLHLRYQSCPDLPKSTSRDMQVECLGSWRNNEIQYFVGRLINEPILLAGDNYRCFMFVPNSSGGEVAISADSSCRELTDMKSATIQISFNQGSYPKPHCSFPKFLVQSSQTGQEYEWVSLGTGLSHSFRGQHWTVANQTARSERAVASSAFCVRQSAYGKMHNFTVYRVQGCERGYQCIKVYRRTSQVIEIQYGQFVKHEFDACDVSHLQEYLPKYETLLLSSSVERACPNSDRGHYSVQGCTQAHSSVMFGCTVTHQLVIDQTCQSGQTHTYNCHSWWEEDSITYLVVREKFTGHRSCFMYTREGDLLNLHSQGRHSCERALLSDLPEVDGFGRQLKARRRASGKCEPVSAALQHGTSATGHMHNYSMFLSNFMFIIILYFT